MDILQSDGRTIFSCRLDMNCIRDTTTGQGVVDGGFERDTTTKGVVDCGYFVFPEGNKCGPSGAKPAEELSVILTARLVADSKFPTEGEVPHE